MKREREYLLHLLGVRLRTAEIHSLTGILGYMSIHWPICPTEQLGS